MDKNKFKKILMVLGTVLLLLSPVLILITLNPIIQEKKPKEIKYEKFLDLVEDEKVKEIRWSENKDTITVTDKKNKKYETENPKYENFKKDMLEHGIEVTESQDIKEKYETPIMICVQIGLYIVFFGALMKGLGVELFQKKEEKDVESNVKFSDVAGLDEVKEDLMTVVDFLKNPEEYKKAGAEIPKGVLLYGPPGTGKTLLAKAVAGEAGVKFKAVSGSDFDEKYVGVGASKMRKMFADAKEKAPCIIFIDEIDSMGGRRHSKQNNYDRQTLNTLLSEMDGFDGSNGVVVIAATNRIEDLDPALTRPGRFDSHFAVNLPETSKDRKIIIDLYSNNKKFADDVDLESFAKETIGNSPASIKTILNEAAIIATRDNDGIINRKILDEAWMKHMMEGHLKKNSEKNEIVAWHEAGHALMGLILGQDLTKVSIIPSTSGAGGVTFITPKKLGLFTKKELEEQVMVLYAGRCAELLFTENEGNITTGASNDIEKATDIIKKMISVYGMSNKFGMLNVEDIDQKLLINEYIFTSEEIERNTNRILRDNKDVLMQIANELVDKETLTGEEVKNIAGESVFQQDNK